MRPSQELIDLLVLNTAESKAKACSWLRKQQVNWLISPEQATNDSLKNLIQHIEEKPAKFNQLDWDKNRFLVYTTISQIINNSFPLHNVEFHTEYGPLFSCITYLKKAPMNRSEHMEEFVKILKDYLNQIGKRTGPINFYTHNNGAEFRYYRFWFQNTYPIPDTHVSFPIGDIQSAVLAADSSKFSESDFTFFSELIFHMGSQEYNVVTKLLTAKVSPWYLMNRVIPSAINIYMKFMKDDGPNQLSSDQFQKIEYFTKIMEEAIEYNHVNLPPQFKWDFIFQFLINLYDEHQIRMIFFITYTILAIPKMHKPVKLVIQKYARTLILNHKKNQLSSGYPLFMYNLVTGIRKIQDKIEAVPVPYIQQKFLKHQNNRLYFSEQSNSSTGVCKDIDDILFTTTNFTIVDSSDKAQAIHADSVKKFKKYEDLLKSPVIFAFTNAIEIINQLRYSPTEVENTANSAIFFTVREIIAALTDLLITVCYKATLQAHYVDHQSTAQKREEIYSFKSIVSKINKLFKAIAQPYEKTVTDIISQTLYKALQNGRITALFCQTISTRNQISTQLFLMLLGSMISLALDSRMDQMIPDIEKSRISANWVMLIVRLSTSREGIQSYPVGRILANYRKPLMNQASVDQLLKITTNQLIVTQKLSTYLKAVNEITSDGKPLQIQTIQIRQPTIKDIVSYARNASLDYLLDPTIEVIPNDMTSMIVLLQLAFKSKNRKHIQRGTKMIKQMMHEMVQKCDFDSDISRQLLANWYTTAKLCNAEDMKFMMEVIVKHKPSFFTKAQNELIPEHGIVMESTGVNMNNLLTAIYDHLTETEEESVHIYVLLTIAIKQIMKEFQNGSKSIIEPLKGIITLLAYLTRFNKLLPVISNCLTNMNEFFLPYFCDGISNDYIFCLLCVAGSSRGFHTKYILSNANKFLSMAAQRGVTEHCIKSLINDIFDSLIPASYYVIILSAIPCIHKAFPEAITPDIIINIVGALRTHQSPDQMLHKQLNTFLKEYINGLDYEKKNNLLMEFFNATNKIHPIIQVNLIKRLRSMKIPITLDTFEKISLRPSDIDTFRIALVFSCGTTIGRFPDSYISMFQNILQTQESQRIAESVFFIHLIYYESILYNQELCEAYFQSPGLRRHITHMFLQSYKAPYIHIHQLMERGLKLIATRFYNDVECMKEIQEHMKQDQRFLLTMAKLVPSFCANDIGKASYFNQIKKFSEITDEVQLMKFRMVNCYYQELGDEKLLNNPDFQKVHNQSNEGNYIDMYVNATLKLMNNREFPFTAIFSQYILKFAVHFPKQFLQSLLNNEKKCQAAELLYYLIINDESDGFYREFLSVNRTDTIHIALPFVKIYSDLAMIPSFRKKPDFDIRIKSMFMKQVQAYSINRTKNENATIVLLLIAKAQLQLLQDTFDASQVISFASIFAYSEFRSSELMTKFKHIFFRKDPELSSLHSQLIIQCCAEIKSMNSSVLEILVGNSIRCSTLTSKLVDMLMNIISRDLLTSTPRHTAMNIKIMRLLLQYQPSAEMPSLKISVIKDLISNYNEDVVIETIRLLTLLVQRSPRASKLYITVVHHLMVNGTLLELPFRPYTFEFIKARRDILEDPPVEIIESVIIYANDHPLAKFNSSIIEIFSTFPELYRVLPLSYICVMCTIYYKNLNQRRAEAKSLGDDYIAFGLLQANSMKHSESELTCFYKICLDYIYKCIKERQEPRDSDIPENLLKFMINKPEGVKFPDSLLNECLNIGESLYDFQKIVLCLGLKYCTPEFIISKSEQIETQFKSLTSQRPPFSEFIYRTACAGFVSSKLIFKQFQGLLIETIKILYRIPGATAFTKARILIDEVCKADIPHLAFLKETWNALSTLTKASWGEALHLHMCTLLEKVVELSKEEQPTYIHSLIGHEKNFHAFAKPLLTVAHRIVSNPSVVPSARREVVRILPSFLEIEKTDLHERILNVISEYGKQTGDDVTELEVRVLLAMAKQGSYQQRTLALDELSRILGERKEERFNKLFLILPKKHWTDSNISSIALVCADKNEAWLPMAALSPSLEDVVPELVYSIFKELVNDETVVTFRELLNSLITAKEKQPKLTGVLVKVFIDIKVPISFDVIRRSSKISPMDWAVQNIIDENTTHEALLQGHSLSPYAFAAIAPRLDIQEQTAAAMFFLGDYDMADEVFDMCSHSDLESFEKIRSITKSVVDDTGPLLKAMNHLDGREDLLLSKLETIASHLSSSTNELINQEIATAEKMNIQYFRSHQEMTDRQRQRVMTAQIMIAAAREHSTDSKIDVTRDINKASTIITPARRALNRYLQSFNPQSVVIWNPTVIPPQPNEECLIVTRDAYRLMNQIAGYTKKGGVALTTSMLEQIANTHATNYKTSAISQLDVLAWESLSSEIFFSSPTPFLLKAALRATLATLGLANSVPIHRQIQSSGRYLMLLRLGMTSSDENMQMAAQESINECSEMPNTEAFLYWPHERFQATQMNSRFAEAVKKQASAKELLSTYYSEIRQMSESKVRELSAINRFFESLFNTDIKTYNMQQKVFELMQQTVILSDEEAAKINIDEISRRLPTTAFENAIGSVPQTVINYVSADFLGFRQNCIAAAASGKLEEYVDSVFPASEEFVQSRARVESAVEAVNLNAPCEINSKIPAYVRKIIRFNNYVEYVDDDTLIVSASTFIPTRMYILVKRNAPLREKLTLSHIIHNIRETVRVFDGPLWLSHGAFSVQCTNEIGPNYLMTFFTSEPRMMSKVFESASSRCRDGESVPKEALKDFMLSIVDQRDYCSARSNLIRSSAAIAVVRTFVNSAFPRLDETIFDFQAGQQTLSALVVTPGNQFDTPFRLSPAMEEFFGPGARPMFALAMAQYAGALYERMEPIVPLLALYDSYRIQSLNVDSIVESRQKVFERIEPLVPPYSKAASADDAIEWYSSLVDYIDSVASPEDKSTDCTPWF